MILLACASFSALGQAASSPFTSFGIGDYYGQAQAQSQGMAGLGISHPEYWYINSQNPALLVFNRFTTFQAGLIGEKRTVRNDSFSEENTNGNLGYLALSVPVFRGKNVWNNSRVTSSISLQPHSSVNYLFSYKQPVVGATDSATVTEEGSGGINSLSWSTGINLHRYISVGFKANYLFSSIENKYSNNVRLDNQAVVFTPLITQRFHYSDFTFTGGVSIHIDSLFGGNYRLNIGSVYDLQSNVRTEYFESLIRTAPDGAEISTDTLTASRLGYTVLPSMWSTGVSFGNGEAWMIGVDYRISNNKDFRVFEKNEAPSQNGWKLTVGAQVVPNPASLSSYLKRMTYRTGVSFEEMPYLVSGSRVRDFGINFGLSLPVSRISSMDVGFRWGKRGNIADNTIDEKYFKIYFGVTFNDTWFIKRRFD